MKNLSVLFFIMLPCFLHAQIGAISGSKISAFSYDPIPKHIVEFEPTFNTQRFKSFWDEEGKNQKLDSTTVESSLCWRITYSPLKKMELGLSIPSDFSTASLAMKYVLAETKNFNLSGMAGTNLAVGNRTFDPKNPTFDDLTSIGVGLIGSFEIDEHNSIDLNLQIQDYFQEISGLTNTGYFINADFGTRVAKDKILLILGTGWQSTTVNNVAQNKMTLYPGISIEYGENFLIVMNYQYDFIGKASEQTTGVSLSLTTLIE